MFLNLALTHVYSFILTTLYRVVNEPPPPPEIQLTRKPDSATAVSLILPLTLTVSVSLSHSLGCYILHSRITMHVGTGK